MAPSEATDLTAPLLDGRRNGIGTFTVEISARSHEWCCDDESSPSSEDDDALKPNRHDRYSRLERGSEAVANWGALPKDLEAGGSASRSVHLDRQAAAGGQSASPLAGCTRGGAGGNASRCPLFCCVHRSEKGSETAAFADKLRCAGALLQFVEVWVATSVLILLAVHDRNFVAAACLIPSHMVQLSLDVYLARKDRSVVRLRQQLRLSGSVWRRILFEVGVVVGLGCCFLYTLVRARRFWMNKASRRTFVMELEAHDPDRRELANHARLDSHAMFVSGVPRVVTLVCLLASHKYGPAMTSVYFVAVCFSSIVVVQAVVNFDYHASRKVQRYYAPGTSCRCRAAHTLYRLSEVVGRILVLAAGALASRYHPAGVAAVAMLDYLLGVVALRIVSRASKKVWFLGIPLLVADVGRYADEEGLALPAQRLSKLLFVVRLVGLAWAATVYAHTSNGSGIHDLPVELCGLMFTAYGVHFALRTFSEVGRAGDDMFTATMRGDVEALSTILPGNNRRFDPDVRAGDRGMRTALHVAAEYGQLECARMLLQCGSDPNLADACGETPLHAACRRGDARLAELLLSWPRNGIVGKNVHLRNHAGRTPLHVLKPGSPKELADLMSEAAERQPGDLTPPRRGSAGRHGPPVESVIAEDLHELFGPVVGGEHYRFSATSKLSARSRGRPKGLISFLFSKGVGEKVSEVLESMRERAAGHSVRLCNLKTFGTLGAGGFGKVIAVRDARSGERYAMKVQRKDRATKCAVREARALHMSKHAFIVRLVHIFHTQTFYCLLMELCQEGNLNEEILESRSDDSNGVAIGLERAKAAQYSVCIMLALEYLHGQYVVFRDLKPENVLISGDHAKLTDFGLARRVDVWAGERGVPGVPRVTLDAESANGSDDYEMGEENEDGSPGESSGGPKTPPAAKNWQSLYLSPPAGTRGFMSSETLARTGFASASCLEELMKWEVGRDWYAMGCCLMLMLLGERGGTRVNVGRRDVLLPPAEDSIIEVLNAAFTARHIDEVAFELARSLTAHSVAERGTAREMRQSSFLCDLVPGLEDVAEEHRQADAAAAALPIHHAGIQRRAADVEFASSDAGQGVGSCRISHSGSSCGSSARSGSRASVDSSFDVECLSTLRT
eukprot:TRINITY_DN61055_c0_g1_i1.p1 TRINITY_DN61055_c0_g1~~TRINITY_DN61055_c0_g1_i1.p1  ORF type:complete len:1142 (-),score=168.33 TRINITY_DN61055_c0_g1_i1:8-3397(-)